MAVIFGAQGAGQAFAFAPDITKAKSATVEVTQLLEHQPDIDAWSEKGQHVERLHEGRIEFNHIHFSYPSR